MSIKRVSSLYLPSIESLQNAHNGSLIYLDSDKKIQVTNNFSVLNGNAATFQLTASDAIYITGSTSAGNAGSVNLSTSAVTNGKLFISGTFNTNNSQNFSNSESTSLIELGSDLVGIENQQISGSWIYKNSTSTEANQILRKNPDKPLNFNISVGTNSSGEDYYILNDTKTDAALASESTPDYRILYIDDSWTNDPAKLANVSGGHSRDVYVHPDTNLIIFNTTQVFYNADKCRIYMPQTSESAAYYSYTAPTSTTDYLKYDGSKIQIVFRKLPLKILYPSGTFLRSTSQNLNYFRLSFEGTISPSNVLHVPFKRGIIAEYKKALANGLTGGIYDINNGFYNNPISQYTYYSFPAITNDNPSGAGGWPVSGFRWWLRRLHNISTKETIRLYALNYNRGSQLGQRTHPQYWDYNSGYYTTYTTNSLTLVFRYRGSGNYRYFIDKDL